MDFFTHQDQARKRSGQLVILFMLAVVCLLGMLNLLAAAALWYGEGHMDFQQHDRQTFIEYLSFYVQSTDALLVSLAALSVIVLASLYKAITLRGGGRKVAEALGGQLIDHNTKDFYQRRLLNVVEEMALASGMPVPPVYLMADDSINAFAAGFQPSDCVIGVTQGCIEQLSRDQLQGVIAHEFSHILNGDMRLNLRLMSLLFGILFIGLIGRTILDALFHGAGAHRRSRSSSDNKNNPLPLAAIAVGLIVIGYAGVFFGNLIKAAVSRQREYLADASAVQFTRNPESISGALKVIGYGAGSEVSSPQRGEVAHLFFGQALGFRFSGFNTHPPLDERIGRVDRNWNGQYLAPQTRKAAEQESPEVAQQAAKATSNEQKQALLATAITAAAAVNTESADNGLAENHQQQQIKQHQNKQQKQETSLQLFRDNAYDSYSARAMILTLLLAQESSLVHDQQLEVIRQQHGQAVFQLCLKLFAARAYLPQEKRLVLVEQAMPALKQLSANQYQDFRRTLVQLAKADGRIDLFEWCLYRLILRYLEPQFENVTPVKSKYSKPAQLSAEIATVLSYLAAHGHDDTAAAQAAFAAACKSADFDSAKIQLLEVDTNSQKALNQALAKLTEAYPHVKGRLVKAMVACVKADNQVNAVEQDLVRTIAAILECPVPGLFE